MRDHEFKRLQAIARANEVFDALSRIGTLRTFIAVKMAHHDKANPHNAGKRDCDAFHGRLAELSLHDQIAKEIEVRTQP